MKSILLILLFIISMPFFGQNDTTYRHNLSINYGVQVKRIGKYIFRPYTGFIQINYERKLNKKWGIVAFFKTDENYQSDFSTNFRLKLNDSITIYQFSWNKNLARIYQIQLGANRKLGKYFSLGAHLLLGYNRKEYWMNFKASSYNIVDSSSIDNCVTCLQSYLGDTYDPNLSSQRYKVGHSNKLSLGTSLAFKFEYPLSKRFSLQLRYGMEMYFNFDLGNTINFSPKVDFYPRSYFRGSHYLTSGINFKF